MLIANQFCRASVMSLFVGTSALLTAQETPQNPPAEGRFGFGAPSEPAPATIFGPVRRRPAPAPADFLLWPPPTSESFSWQTAGAPQRPAAPTPQFSGERPVCPRTVTVDPKIDPQFVQPLPESGATIQRVVPPPCVRTTESLR